MKRIRTTALSCIYYTYIYDDYRDFNGVTVSEHFDVDPDPHQVCIRVQFRVRPYFKNMKSEYLDYSPLTDKNQILRK